LESACICNAGSTEDSGSCVQCEAGKYKTSPGSDQCTDCDAGKYSSTVGATTYTVCQDCPEYTYRIQTGASAVGDCQSCPTHSSAPPGSDALENCMCDVGHTGSNGGPCTACEAGKYKSTTGSDDCIDCGPGKYSESVGETSESVCLECDAGKYADTVGSSHATMCTTCPPDSTSPQGSPRRTACKCSAGFTGADGFPCTACEAGKYKAESGSAACTDCSAGKYSSNVALATEAECVACAAETVSPAGSDSASDCVEPGPCVIEGKNPSTGYMPSVKEHQDGWLTNPQEDFHCPQSRHTGFVWYNFPSYTQLFCLYGQYSLVSDANAVTTYYDSTWCG
jgi:syndecan 4